MTFLVKKLLQNIKEDISRHGFIWLVGSYGFWFD